MSRKQVAFTGILGVSLFAFAAIVGPLLIDNYSVFEQFISESFAITTEYGRYLQYFGYVPSGLFTIIFCIKIIKFLPDSKLVKGGFLGLAMFYGLATILVGLFPCDAGCPTNIVNSSTSQLIHNATATLTYFFVPILIFGIGLGLRKFKDYNRLSQIAMTTGILSAIFIFMLFSNPESDFRGLLQRIIEILFITLIVASSISIWKTPKIIIK